MDKIKIITDTTCDLPKEVLEKFDVEVIPVLINFGEESYLDGVEITRDDVFRRIDAGDVFPTTAQITPNRFEEYFNKYLNEGYKVLAILMSSGMSGTYQSACLAKNMLDNDDIHIVDSQSICSGLGLLVIRAAKLREQGVAVEDIVRDLEETKYKISSSLSFDSLDNLVKGGRISKTVGVVTGILGIKLILEIKDGTMTVKDKVRGSKKAIKRIIADLDQLGHNPEVPVVLVNLDMDEICQPIRDYLNENNIEYIEGPVGSSVGIHSGNKVSGIFFISE
ncbi:DegV family protein [Clostridium paraputrificum]|uniref:DegV family protein n=1 Tax=Clostridium TaxID=1485 RepID=UPI003D34A8F4